MKKGFITEGVASSRRSVSQGATQKTAREKNRKKYLRPFSVLCPDLLNAWKRLLKVKRSGFLEPTLQIQSLKIIFVTYKQNLRVRGFPDFMVKLSPHRSQIHKQKSAMQSRSMPFVTQYNSAVPNLKTILRE